ISVASSPRWLGLSQETDRQSGEGVTRRSESRPPDFREIPQYAPGIATMQSDKREVVVETQIHSPATISPSSSPR
ncbi:hypothetical protein B0T09DRAFT_231506, partial [Sordaria sp. MPI-SDFR-AT-0083]